MRVILESDYSHPPEIDWSDDDFRTNFCSIMLDDDGTYHLQSWLDEPVLLDITVQPAPVVNRW